MTSGASVVALASGRLNYGTQDAAGILREALQKEVISRSGAGTLLTVAGAAQACFDAMVAAEYKYSILGSGVDVVVAGYDEGAYEAQVYEFTAPATIGEPRLCQAFHDDHFLALPKFNDTSDLVQGQFGLLTFAEFVERLDDFPHDPSADFRGQFSLKGECLDVIASSVADRLPKFLATDTARLDQEGVGGQWLVCRVRPNLDVEEEAHAWGPMRPNTCDSPS